MATSKTYSKTCSAVGGFSYAGNFKLYIELNETDVSTSSNTSKVKYKVYCQSSGSGSISAKHLKKFIINGKTIINETVSVNVSSPNAYISIASGTTSAITHNSDGSKSISFEAQIKASSYGVSASYSGTFTLSNIPRYATANQSLNSKTSSSIKMNWSSDNTIDYIWYSTNNGSSWTGVDVADSTSGNYNITGLAANTTYTIKTRVRRKDSQLTTDSTALSVTTYAKTLPSIWLSSKTVNSITVASNCNVGVSSTQYRIRPSNGSFGAYQTSATFTGLTPNTEYIVKVYMIGSDSGESGTASTSITTYNYATITAPNFNLGDSFNITISNPSGQSIQFFMETLNSGSRDDTITVRNINAGTTSITLNDNELDMIYKKINTGFSTVVRIGVITIGTYYNWQDKTCTLTGNQKTGHINIDGSWKRSKKWININGTWRRCVRWININGTWKKCI